MAAELELPEIANTRIGPDGQPIEEPIAVNEGEIEGDNMEEDENYDKFAEPGRVRRLPSILNLLNSLLGAGILSVPASLRYVGIIPSIIILVFIACISCVATILTIKLQKRANADGFDDLAMKVLGKYGSIILSILSMTFLITALVAYIIIGGQMLISWFSSAGVDLSPFGIRCAMILVYSLLIPIPFTIPRQVKILTNFSTVNFICVTFFVIVMLIKACVMLPKQGVSDTVVYGQFGFGVFSAISIYGLAFALPVVVLPIINPYNKDLHKRSIVSICATILCLVYVLIPAISGYLIFGENTNGNVLLSFDSNDILIILTQIAFFAIVNCSYPCVAQSVMASWSQLLFGINDHTSINTKQRITVVACTNALPVLIAMVFPNATPILSVGGALGGTVADFVYPALMWIVLSKQKWYTPQNIACLLLVIFGIVAAAIATYLAVIDAINDLKGN